jgi:hypothetical protein
MIKDSDNERFQVFNSSSSESPSESRCAAAGSALIWHHLDMPHSGWQAQACRRHEPTAVTVCGQSKLEPLASAENVDTKIIRPTRNLNMNRDVRWSQVTGGGPVPGWCLPEQGRGAPGPGPGIGDSDEPPTKPKLTSASGKTTPWASQYQYHDIPVYPGIGFSESDWDNSDSESLAG